MSPEAKSRTLLYVADAATSDVYALAYPGGKWMGALTGFNNLNGICSDEMGDVYIPQAGAQNVEEFAHGGTSPIRTLMLTGEATGCSVDSTTGNVAVATFSGSSPSGSGGIWIFPSGSSSGTLYQDPDLAYLWPPGYDDQGNLFVQGADFYGLIDLAELPAGGSRFKNLTVDYTVYFPGSVMWDGSHLGVTDQLYKGVLLTAIYRVSISGSHGKAVGVTVLKQPEDCIHAIDVFQPWIQGGTVIGGNDDCETIDYWKYPAGGAPKKFLFGISVSPTGVTISKPSGSYGGR